MVKSSLHIISFMSTICPQPDLHKFVLSCCHPYIMEKPGSISVSPEATASYSDPQEPNKHPKANAKFGHKFWNMTKSLYVMMGRVQLPIGLRRILRQWWLEMLSLFSVVAAFIAVVATLCQFRDRSIPQWPANLSINALLSLYGIAFRTPMLLLVAEGNAPL